MIIVLALVRCARILEISPKFSASLRWRGN